MKLRFDLAPVIVEHIAEDHRGVLATKELRFCGPLAPGPATDQGHFPSQPAHDSLLLARACAHTLLSACDGPIVARGETLSTLSWLQQDYSSLCRDSRIGKIKGLLTLPWPHLPSALQPPAGAAHNKAERGAA